MVQIDRPNKTYTTIEYNDMDQVTKLINYSKGKILSSFQYEYDLSGFIVKEIASQDKEETITSTYAYDYRCQLVRVRMTTESGPVIEREYAYDKAGNRIMEETTSDGVVIRRVESEYDDASRLISQNIWEDSAPGHSGDKPEKPEKPHTDNGHHYGNDKGDNHIDKKGQQKKEDISSNADNQEAIANNTAELLPPDVYDSGVEAWSGKHDPDQTISYQYDENGNLTEKSGSDIDTFSYQYDNENRLRAVMQNGTVLMAALYDGNGDRIFKLQRHSTSGNVPSSEEKKNNGNNKNKDKDKNNGNQGSSTNGDVPVDLALLEDVMLLPTGANKINIESFDLTGYINDVNQQYTQVLMEYGKNGKYNSIYSYGLQRLGADYSGAQTVYLYDGRGSMVNETNGSGTSMSAYLYDEWGNLLSGKVHTNGFYSDLYLYNGEATDITTGLQYLRARYYDPGTGRFVQEDTVLGSLTRPLTQNLYAYCGNNPLNYIDPSGHDWWSDLGDGLSNAWSQVTNWAENTSQQIGNWFDARTQEASSFLMAKLEQAEEKIAAVQCMDWKSFGRGLVYELFYNASTTMMSPFDMVITISGVNLPTFREFVQDDYLISGDPYMYYLGKVTGDVIALVIGVAATIKGALGIIAGITGGALLSVPSLGTSVVVGGTAVAVSITEVAAGSILVANSAVALSTNLNHLSFYEKMRETSSTGKENSETSLDYKDKITERNGKYYTDKETLDEIGRIESEGVDFSKLNKQLQSSRPSSEGGVGTSNVYKYSDSEGTRFIIHEVTDSSGNIIHRDFDAVRIPSGQLILKE